MALMQAVDVHEASQAAGARRTASALARQFGFDEQDVGRVAIVASELATNLVKHGGGGQLLLGSFDDDSGSGLECIALDKGPGMADVAASMRDGHSTSGSAGTGLGAVRRGSHLSAIYTVPGMGTAILARLQPGQPDPAKPLGLPAFGALSIPMRGEEACGDDWCFRATAGGAIVMVADGLGHGPLAADAAHAASRVFLSHYGEEPGMILTRMAGPVHSTRGAAVAIARYDRAAGKIVFAGVGNVAGSVLEPGGAMRRMVSHNGTIGHVVKRIQEFTYPSTANALVVLASDGLGTSWSFDRYPRLAQCHPSMIAAVLYRDFTRGRDDVTVLVIRTGLE